MGAPQGLSTLRCAKPWAVWHHRGFLSSRKRRVGRTCEVASAGRAEEPDEEDEDFVCSAWDGRGTG